MIGRLEHDDVFAVTTLAVADPDLLAELRVPPVADDGNFTDMGRMNGDSPAAEIMLSRGLCGAAGGGGSGCRLSLSDRRGSSLVYSA